MRWTTATGQLAAHALLVAGVTARSRLAAAPRPAAPCAAAAVAQSRRSVRPPLIPRTAQPHVELVLDRALDDQPGAELRELRQRRARILAHPNGEQRADPLLDLRGRRYRASDGVGPPSSFVRTSRNLRCGPTAPAIYSTSATRPARASLAVGTSSIATMSHAWIGQARSTASMEDQWRAGVALGPRPARFVS
jgi:hypothetical protein